MSIKLCEEHLCAFCRLTLSCYGQATAVRVLVYEFASLPERSTLLVSHSYHFICTHHWSTFGFKKRSSHVDRSHVTDPSQSSFVFLSLPVGSLSIVHGWNGLSVSSQTVENLTSIVCAKPVRCHLCSPRSSCTSSQLARSRSFFVDSLPRSLTSPSLPGTQFPGD